MVNFFQKVGSLLSNTYGSVISALTSAYNVVRPIVSAVKSGADWVDSALNSVNDIPVIGNVAQVIRGNPIYQEARGLINSADSALRYANDWAQPIDHAISSGISALQSAGSLQKSSVPSVNNVNGFSAVN